MTVIRKHEPFVVLQTRVTVDGAPTTTLRGNLVSFSPRSRMGHFPVGLPASQGFILAGFLPGNDVEYEHQHRGPMTSIGREKGLKMEETFRPPA